MFKKLARSLGVVAALAAAATLGVTAPASAEASVSTQGNGPSWYGEDGAAGQSMLMWSEDRLIGFDGCNAFEVRLDAAFVNLPLQPRTSTLMYCSVKTALEQAYYATFNGDGSLDLHSEDGQKLGTMLRAGS